MVEYEDIKVPEELYFYMKNFKYGYLNRKGSIVKTKKFLFDEYCFDNYVLQNTNDLNNSKTGICLDLTEFSRDWLIKHNYKVKTYYEYVENKLSFSHSFVAYNDKRHGSTWNWIETTWKKYDGIHVYSNLEMLHSSNYKLYKGELDRNTVNYKDIKIMEFDVPKEHSTLGEYLKNARKGRVLTLKR